MSGPFARFWPDRECLKCGSRHRLPEFHPVHLRELVKPLPDCMMLAFEHMLVQCERCGYAVIEMPLDAEP